MNKDILISHKEFIKRRQIQEAELQQQRLEQQYQEQPKQTPLDVLQQVVKQMSREERLTVAILTLDYLSQTDLNQVFKALRNNPKIQKAIKQHKETNK